MTYYSDATPVSYMSDGPGYPGEDAHTAMGENTAHALTGHLLSRSAQGVGPQPSHGFEDEALNRAEQAAQHTAQTVAADTQDQAPAPSLSHAQVASDVRQALRPGMGA